MLGPDKPGPSVIPHYTIYLNRLYKFTTAKPAGPWDGSKVVPVSVAGELAQLYGKTDTVITPSSGVTGGDPAALESYMNNISKNLGEYTYYQRCISLSVAYAPFGGGGIFHIDGMKGNDNYEWQRVTSYDSETGVKILARDKRSGKWASWNKIV